MADEFCRHGVHAGNYCSKCGKEVVSAEMAMAAREADPTEGLPDDLVREHRERSFKDYSKSFRSRPGSADWRSACTCGWESKVWYYGKSGARSGWLRHFDAAEYAAWKEARERGL